MDYRDAEQGTIRVFLADDNLIVREGVRALIERHRDLRVVGVAADYDEVVSGAAATGPQVLVTDIRELSGVGRGEFVAVMGPDCGESTLLTAFAGLDRPDEGTIEAGAGRAVRMRAERADERACGLP